VGCCSTRPSVRMIDPGHLELFYPNSSFSVRSFHGGIRLRTLHGSALEVSHGVINLAWDSVHIFGFLRFGGAFDTTPSCREASVVH